MIWLFRASAIALALLWTNWRDLDAIGEIFMPVLVGLADELVHGWFMRMTGKCPSEAYDRQ